jgi:hypothetical protein
MKLDRGNVIKKYLGNNSGSAIIMALFVTVGLIAYTLYFINSAKLQSKISTQAKNDVNVMAVAAEMKSTLNTATNCNATFLGKPVSSNLTSIEKCTTGQQCFTTVTSTPTIKKVTNNSWAQADTGITIPNVRIIDMPYAITQNQIDTTFPVKPAVITINTKFEKKNGTTVSVETMPIEVMVVLNAAHTAIVGCPKDPTNVDAAGDMSCHYPWGEWLTKLANGSSVSAYNVTHAPNCATHRETRACTNTVLSGSYTNQNCINDGDWTAWSSWSACSASCGGGTQTQTRTCTNPSLDAGGSGCIGSNTQSQACNTTACGPAPIDGGWTAWSGWSGCSALCGMNGLKSSTRTCTNPAPANGGADCVGSNIQSVTCIGFCVPMPAPAPVDGGWSAWSYGACSNSCGSGTMTASRICNNPAPANGGANCDNPTITSVSLACTGTTCPIISVNGGWSSWSGWSSCSASCGGGTKTRTRSCNNPAPSGGGANCSGSAVDSNSCNTGACPGTVTGSASCSYAFSGPCAGGCGPGFGAGGVWCPSTWTYSGTAKSGGCNGPNDMVGTEYQPGGVTAFDCVSR